MATLGRAGPGDVCDPAYSPFSWDWELLYIAGTRRLAGHTASPSGVWAMIWLGGRVAAAGTGPGAGARLPRPGRSESSFRRDPSVCPVMLRHTE